MGSSLKRTTRGRVLAAVLAVGLLTGCSGHGDGKGNDKASGAAAAALKELGVKKAASKSGYDRVAKFGPAWSDSTSAPGSGNRCDTRNDILGRDLKSTRFDGSSKCVVDSGTLADPYTGKTIRFKRGRQTSSAVQID